MKKKIERKLEESPVKKAPGKRNENNGNGDEF